MAAVASGPAAFPGSASKASMRVRYLVGSRAFLIHWLAGNCLV